ncbi:TPA: hypothetical protein F7Z80_08955 [Legionella pneumophila]|nr:hypothetical protein AXF36_11115 [Legionella pneumophila subsp. pascullei]AMP96098.1 hypothetical protein AXF37_11005 [Legionella pneumophila subsp. pascullei]AWG45553.1 hypothetical protein AXF35_15495 [Legionella pneumophila subsp. pascullei]HAU3861920.1 hypothetical protein [Legionella pneumophila]HAU4217612.1 hypothetical protein [Legionella pneumophila]
MHQAILSGCFNSGIDYKEDLYKKQFILPARLILTKPYFYHTLRVNPHRTMPAFQKEDAVLL